MKKQFVTFNEERDFNGVINDMFLFLKTDYKLLFKSLLYYAGPLLLLSGIMMAQYQNSAIGITTSNLNDPFAAYRGMATMPYLFAILFSMLGNIAVITVVYSYIQLTKELGPGNFEIEDVWDKTKQHFLGNFGATIVIGVLTVLGLVFFIVPGIYLGIALIMVLPLMQFSGFSLSEAIRESFQLIKGHWWQTFAIMLVVYLIVSVGSSIFLIPQMILTAIYTFNTITEGGSSSPSLLFTIVTALGTFLASFLYSLIYIATALQFHNLVQRKENPELVGRIEAINSPSDNDDLGNDDIEDVFNKNNKVDF